MQYCPFSAMVLIRFRITPQFITPCTNNIGGIWIFVELGFPTIESLFVSFVNRRYRLLISIFVSGVLCCVVSCVFSLFQCILSLVIYFGCFILLRAHNDRQRANDIPSSLHYQRRFIKLCNICGIIRCIQNIVAIIENKPNLVSAT